MQETTLKVGERMTENARLADRSNCVTRYSVRVMGAFSCHLSAMKRRKNEVLVLRKINDFLVSLRSSFLPACSTHKCRAMGKDRHE